MVPAITRHRPVFVSEISLRRSLLVVVRHIFTQPKLLLQATENHRHNQPHTSKSAKSPQPSRRSRWFPQRLSRRQSTSVRKSKFRSLFSRILNSHSRALGFPGPLVSVFARLKFLRSSCDFRNTTMSLNKYVDEQGAHDFDKREYTPDNDDYDDYGLPHHSSTSSSSARTTFMSIRTKAEGMLSQFATKHANASFSRQISRIVTTGSVSSGGPVNANGSGNHPAYLEPTKDEELALYPSYCRKVEPPEPNADNDSSEYKSAREEQSHIPPYYELDVRGCVTLPPPQNRRTKLVLGAARKIAGVTAPRASSSSVNFDFYENDNTRDSRAGSTSTTNSQSVDDLFADLQNIQNERPDTDHTPRLQPTPSINKPSDTLDARMRPFLSRPIVGRTIDVEVFSSSGESMIFEHTVETETTGRFNTRLQIPFQPVYARITSGLKHAEIDIEYVPPVGVSVISDIDDTIKITGILGGKRDLFKNVFVNDYTKIEVPGIRDCFASLEKEGARFHYVSNSPWQLYPTIKEYIGSAKFPKGSMHLKTYPNLANGIFEPAAGKKKKNLYQIFRDFPKRKFILFGDSGEGDLEAYMDVASSFPDQIFAIMIRDITLPDHDNSMHVLNTMGREGGIREEDIELFRRNFVPTPEEIDRYDSPRSTRSTRFTSNSNLSRPSTTNPSSGPPLPPRPRVESAPAESKSIDASSLSPPPPPPSRRTETPPLIDLSDTEPSPKLISKELSEELSEELSDLDLKPKFPSKQPPKLPPKPKSLQGTKLSPPPVPPKPFALSNGTPKSSQTDLASLNPIQKLPTHADQAPTLPNSASSDDSAPPPLPRRPDHNLIINSASRGAIDSRNFPPPPPLPRGSRTPTNSINSVSSTSHMLDNDRASTMSSSTSTINSGYTRPHHPSPIVLSSSQDDFYDLLDKRIEGWKARVFMVRNKLPSNTVLRMWRTGFDIHEEARELVRREAQKQETLI